MTLNRFAQRRDLSEPDIVKYLEAAGFRVLRLAKPADLSVRRDWWPRGSAMNLEVKTPTKTGRIVVDKRQLVQNDFIARGGSVVVGTPGEALQALRDFELVISP